MAFQIKYSKRFQRMGTTATYRIDILSEAGGAVITPWKMGADPCQVKTLASEKDENKIVIGSELTFEFVLQKRIGETDYDPLFESEYREHIVKYYNHSTGTLLWQGYLQPENMYRSMFESNLHIFGSATDALKDLSEYEFRNGGLIVLDRMTGLEIIKLCLTNLDQDSQFQYNFIVKLGTKHTGEGANDNALEEVTHDTRQFSRITDGNTDIDNCLTVIEKVLKPYSCTLQQWGGKYYILSRHEAATNYYTYNWALVFQSKAASNDAVNIDTYKFSREADISMISPVKEVTLKLLNRNIGGSLVANMNDYLAAAAVWDYTNYTSAFDDSKTYMCLTAEHDVGAPGISNGYMTLVSDVSIQKITEGDYLKLRFSYRHTTSGIADLTWPQFQIKVIKDGDLYDTVFPIFIMDDYLLYESEVNAVFKLMGNVGETYDYNFQIEIITNDTVNDYEIRMIDFDLTKITVVEGENMEDVIFDTFYRATSAQGKIKYDAGDFSFGDSGTITDFAALVYAAAVTEEWDREGEADDQKLLYLWAKNYLISRQDYAEYIICNIKDSGDNITPVNYIEWDGKKYHIVSYEKSWRSSWIVLHLKQWFTSDLTIGWSIIPLTSIEGHGSGASTPYVSPSSTTTHNTLFGLQGGTANEYYHLNASEYTELHGWLDNVVLGNDGSTTLAGTTTLSATTLVPDGGTIGQVAGPLLTFDDSNNYLRITGCNVIIGGSVANYKLEVNTNHAIDIDDEIVIGSYYEGNLYGIGLNYRIDGVGNPTEHIVTHSGGIRTTVMSLIGGNVGIGTTAPFSTLTIKDDLYKLGFEYRADAASRRWWVGTDYTAYGDFFIGTEATKGNTSPSLIRFYINPAGNVGFGIAAPAENVHIYSAGACRTRIESGGSSAATLELKNTEGNYAWYTDGDKLIAYDYTDSKNRIQVDGDGNFEHPSFSSGWTGTNWQIAEDGDAEFRNVLISGGLQVYELIINQLHYQNGGLIIGSGAGKVATITNATQGAEKMTFEDPEGTAMVPFSVGSVVLVQRVDINRTTVVKKYARQVKAIVGMEVEMEATTGWIPVASDVGAFEVGDEICAIGHTTTDSLKNSIYLSAIDSNNPFLKVMSGVTNYTDWVGADTDYVKLLLGNLEFMSGTGIVPFNPGYGLYSDNVYLTGRIVLPDCGMTNEGALASSVRIYAGDTYANRAIANFNVTQDGSCTAKGVVEFGTNVGLDPESVDTNNITMVGCQMYEASRNDDTGSIYFNTCGYQGGVTKYRNTYIGDGKAGYLLQCIGISHTASIYQAFSFVPHTFDSDYDLQGLEIFNALFIMENSASGDVTLTLPDGGDILTQFGQGKSANNPFIIIINDSSTHDLDVTTYDQSSLFWASGAGTKTYTISPNRSCIMTFVEIGGSTGDWYVLET